MSIACKVKLTTYKEMIIFWVGLIKILGGVSIFVEKGLLSFRGRGCSKKLTLH